MRLFIGRKKKLSEYAIMRKCWAISSLLSDLSHLYRIPTLYYENAE